MLVVGDIVRIFGLTSEDGRCINSMYGMGTASQNAAGCFRVTLARRRPEGNPRPSESAYLIYFDESKAVLLKL